MLPALVTRLHTALAAAVLAVAGAAHATEGVTDTTIRIGLSSPLSGPTGAYGRAMKEGIEACFAQVNARGGVEPELRS